jgi:3'-5' exoribonuclease
VAKVYAKDVHDKEAVKSVFLVARKTATTAKNGKPFVAVILRDKTGDLDARIWERIEELDPTFARGDFVEVEGLATTFQGRPQLKIDAIKKVDPLALDITDFTAPPKAEPGERFVGPILEIVERLHDPHIKALLRSFLDDEAFVAMFRRAPAAKTIHHAYHGGLAEHTLSVMRLAQRVADQYPMADRDLLLAGAFLHDLGKLKELTWERQTEYTDVGRLVGHLVICSEWIHERADCIEGFPPALECHLKHLVLSHHGTLEFGSPRLPQTLEAMLLHHIDELDSRVASWLELMRRDSGETWTDFQKLYDRHIYKGASPTLGGKTPVERRHRKDKPRREPREPGAAERTQAAGDGAAVAADAPKPQPEKADGTPPRPEGQAAAVRPERPDRPPRERRGKDPKKPEEKLTFKPFAALVAGAPETPASAEASAEPASSKPDQSQQAEAVTSAAQALPETVPPEEAAPTTSQEEPSNDG